MVKINPQHRIHSTVVSMVESRQRSASRAEADDWIERGWNPFILQKDNRWDAQTAFGLMIDEGSWTDWITKHKDRWPALAQQAFKPNLQGKLDGGELVHAAAKRAWGRSEWSAPDYVDTLELLLALGLDPNGSTTRTRGSARTPAIFDATRHGAELLVAAGADLAGRGPNGEGCWEHWAARAMSSKLQMADLDWLAERSAPTWTGRGSSAIGLRAIANRSSPIAQRLADAGAGLAAFGMDTPEGMSHALDRLVSWPDNSAVLEIVGSIVGWDPIIKAFLADDGMSAPIRSALFLGNVRCLGVLERHGLLGPGGTTAENLARMGEECWRLTSARQPGKNLGSTWNPNRISAFIHDRPQAPGLAWALRRLPAGKADLAVAILESCVKSHPSDTARLVQTCASKGFLPDSGPGSLRALYNDGDSWPGQVGTGGKSLDFTAFTALCEDKSFRKAFKPKATKKPVARSRL